MALDPSRIIDGTFGYVYIDGNWQTNFNKCEASVEIQKKELNLSGDPWTRHKKGALKGTGTVSGFKVTSDMIRRGFSKFTIIVKLNDLESYGHETIRLDNCMADKIQLANFTANENVTEDIGFTFEGYELLDPIVGF